MPRRYRGRDIWFWLGQIGNLDEKIDEQADPAAAANAPSLVVSGVDSGSMLDLGVLGDHGVTVAGRLDRFDRGQAVFLDDLDATTGESDRAMRGLLDRIDASIDTSPCADDVPRAAPIPALELLEPPRSLDLAEAGISTIVWATGYGRSYDWLHLPALGATARSSSGAASRRCPVCTWSVSVSSTGASPTSSAASARTPSSSLSGSSPPTPTRRRASSAGSSPSPAPSRRDQ